MRDGLGRGPIRFGAMRMMARMMTGLMILGRMMREMNLWGHIGISDLRFQISEEDRDARELRESARMGSEEHGINMAGKK